MIGSKRSRSRVLMVQGASSSAGKSFLVTALCRSFARRGVHVAPFKAQNMSNNAAVCPDGAEIGRAQYVQALAAGIEPCVQINPILIKPEADARSQVVVMGKSYKTSTASTYYDLKNELWIHVTSALDHLRANHELVIIEGAGSPTELNLKSKDLVNMAIAKYASSPVLLVGDIDRGGIFAQLLGTLWLLEPEELDLVRGLVVNKFRGDFTLFQDGIQILEEKSRLPVLGVIPYLKDLHFPEEDAVSLYEKPSIVDQSSIVEIAILRLPLISNFDEFDPLRAEHGVQIRYISSPDELGLPHAIIIPGTKSTVADLAWLRERKLDKALVRHVQKGGVLVGICGGYQMLGQIIHDPLGVESHVESTPGLGFLPVVTSFSVAKTTSQVRVRIHTPQTSLESTDWLASIQDQYLEGYEIHMGQTESDSPWLTITSRNGTPTNYFEGAISPDGKIWGCYIHDIFTNQNLRHAWLNSLGWSLERISNSENQLPGLFSWMADSIEKALDMPRLEKIIWEN